MPRGRRPPQVLPTNAGEISALPFKWMFGKSEHLKVVQMYFHMKKKNPHKVKPEAPSGVNRLRFLDTYILHVCWCWVDGWGRMQIFNVVTELDWMFYGRSLSWQRATACKSNWKEENEGAGTPLYQGLGCKNRIWHRITHWAEFILGAEIGTISGKNIQYFLIWHYDL